MEQFELADTEWTEVLEVTRAEGEKRGIDPNDFAAMLDLMKKIWKLLIDPANRKRKIDHAKRIRLEKNKADQEKDLQATNDELRTLPPDPGDPIPDPPKPQPPAPQPPQPPVRPEVNPGQPGPGPGRGRPQ